MKLVIPRLKADQICLTKAWSFKLYHERRNDGLLIHFDVHIKHSWRSTTTNFTPARLPKGTLMTVERYYIRQNNEQFDSVTFMIHELDGSPLKKKIRFWVKLDEALLMDFKYL
jgi:hypothetical protein